LNCTNIGDLQSSETVTSSNAQSSIEHRLTELSNYNENNWLNVESAVEPQYGTSVVTNADSGLLTGNSTPTPPVVFNFYNAVLVAPGVNENILGVVDQTSNEFIQHSSTFIPNTPVCQIPQHLPQFDEGTTGSTTYADNGECNYATVTTSSAVFSQNLFTDDYLATVSQKDLNRQMQEFGLSAEDVQQLRKKRRTLKNRGYAQSCRQKRVGHNHEVDSDNSKLRKEIKLEQAKRREVQIELETLKKEHQHLKERNVQLEAIVAQSGYGMVLAADTGVDL